MKVGICLFVAVQIWVMSNADARLYRWADEQGNVYYSDKMPDAQAKSVTELDRRGMIRKVPAHQASAGELARQEEAQKLRQIQRRRDKALLDSFSSTAEIDALRDRQIDAVAVRRQTILLREQEATGKYEHLIQQADLLRRKNKKIPDALSENIDMTRLELERLKLDSSKAMDEITSIRDRAEYDKKRYIELSGAH